MQQRQRSIILVHEVACYCVFTSFFSLYIKKGGKSVFFYILLCGRQGKIYNIGKKPIDFFLLGPCENQRVMSYSSKVRLGTDFDQLLTEEQRRQMHTGVSEVSLLPGFHCESPHKHYSSAYCAVQWVLLLMHMFSTSLQAQQQTFQDSGLLSFVRYC